LRDLKKLDIDQSVKKKQLVFAEDWQDKLNRITVYIVFSAFIYLPPIALWYEDLSGNSWALFWYFLAFSSICFGVYVCYRNATEKRLTGISTGMESAVVLQLLLEYAEKKEWEVGRKSNGCLICYSSPSSWKTKYIKTRIFFLIDGSVLFTMIQSNYRLDTPVLLEHLLLKNDLKRMLNDKVQ
jgi:hypothetical protein